MGSLIPRVFFNVKKQPDIWFGFGFFLSILRDGEPDPAGLYSSVIPAFISPPPPRYSISRHRHPTAVIFDDDGDHNGGQREREGGRERGERRAERGTIGERERKATEKEREGELGGTRRERSSIDN